VSILDKPLLTELYRGRYKTRLKIKTTGVFLSLSISSEVNRWRESCCTRIISESYLDFDGGLLCKALSRYLDKERM